MEQEQYIDMNSEIARRPQMIQQLESRNPLTQPSAELMSTQDFLKILKQYLSYMQKDKLPEEGKAVYDFIFGFINSQAMITFYDEKEKEIFDIDWEIAILDFKMSRPLGKMTMEEVAVITNMKRYADSLFFRNVGFANGRMNERSHQSASIIQHVTSNPGMQTPPKKRGPLSFLGL